MEERDTYSRSRQIRRSRARRNGESLDQGGGKGRIFLLIGCQGVRTKEGRCSFISLPFYRKKDTKLANNRVALKGEVRTKLFESGDVMRIGISQTSNNHNRVLKTSLLNCSSDSVAESPTRHGGKFALGDQVRKA